MTPPGRPFNQPNYRPRRARDPERLPGASLDGPPVAYPSPRSEALRADLEALERVWGSRPMRPPGKR